MNKIGVLLVESLPLPPVKGGAVENLVQLIIENNEQHQDFEICVFSNYDAKADEISRTFKYTSYKYFKPNGFWIVLDILLKVIRKLLRIFFQINTPSLYEIKAYNYFKKQNIKILVLENCPLYALYQNRKNDFYLIQHLHNDYLNTPSKQNDKIFNHTQRIFAVSNFIKTRLEPIVPKGIPIDVCYNGLNLKPFFTPINDNIKNQLLTKYNILETDRVITFTGRLVNNKGVKELMLAFEMFAHKYEDIKLLIIGGLSFSNNGKDYYSIELDKISQRLGDKVILTGYIDYKEIADYLKLSTLVVVPSICYESFSLSTLEAIASGIPVVVSDAGGILEVIDKQSGIVVKRGDNFVTELSYVIENLISNQSMLRGMSVAATERSKLFTDSIMYNRFVELMKLIK